MFNIDHKAVEQQATNILQIADKKYIDAAVDIIKLVQSENCRFENVHWLIDQKITRADIYPLTLFCENPLRIGNVITNYLFQEYKFTQVRMSTWIEYKEFMIDNAGRRLVHLHKYPSIKKIQSEKLFIPIEKKLEGDLVVNLLSVEIGLQKILHEMYSPEPALWDVEILKTAIENLLPDAKYDIPDVLLGGKPKFKTNKTNKYKEFIYNSIKLASHDMIFIGNWALYALGSIEQMPLRSKIQLISDAEPESIVELLKNAIRHPVDITHNKESLGLANDHWTTRTIFYVYDEENDKKVPIVDVFNSTTWELIPYVLTGKDNVPVGNPFVIARFLLIDMWVVSMLNNLNKITEEYYMIFKRNTLKNIELVLNFSKYMFGDQYKGVYINPTVLKKQLTNASNKIIYPYVPSRQIRNI